METYTLRNISNSTDYMQIVQKREDGYVVRIIRDKDGYQDISNDFISTALFDSCLRTGYITKISSSKKFAVNE